MLIDVAKFLEKNPSFLQLERVISVAEVLRKQINNIYKKCSTKHSSSHQCTEGFLARTCEYGTLHFNEDLSESRKIYRRSKYRYHPIITDFTRSSQPLIRYELNDIIIDKKNLVPVEVYFRLLENRRAFR